MGHTPGPWKVFVDDSGGQWTGWPLSITAPKVHEDCMVVRTGGQWPYEWDRAISQTEAVANSHLIAAAPDMLAALTSVLLHVKPTARNAACLNAVHRVIAKAEGRSDG